MTLRIAKVAKLLPTAVREADRWLVRRPAWGRGMALFLAVLLAGLHFFFRPSVQHQVWDSLECAYVAEETAWGRINMDHPLGHVVLNGGYVIARMLGYDGRALTVFAGANAVLAACALYALFSLFAGVMGIAPLLSLGLVLFVGSVNGMWRYAGTGDIYVFVILTSVLAWREMVKWGRSAVGAGHSWLAAGLLCAAALAAYKVNGMLVAAGCLIGWREGRRSLREVAGFIAAGLTVGVCGYLLCGWLAYPAGTSASAGWAWTTSQFTDQIWGRFLMWSFLGEGIKAAQGAFLAPAWNEPARVWRAGVTVLCSLLLVYAVGRVVLQRGAGWRKRVTLGALAQAGLSAILIQWWRPWSGKIWFPLIVPAAVMIGAYVAGREWNKEEGRHSPRFACANLLAWGLAGSVLLFNLWFGGLSQWRNSRVFDRAVSTWLEYTDANDTVITAGDLMPQLRFWYDRPKTRPLMEIYRKQDSNRFKEVRADFDRALRMGSGVYVSRAITNYLWEPLLEASGVSPGDLADFFDEYEWEYAFTYTNETDETAAAVHRLSGRRTPLGANKR